MTGALAIGVGVAHAMTKNSNAAVIAKAPTIQVPMRDPWAGVTVIKVSDLGPDWRAQLGLESGDNPAGDQLSWWLLGIDDPARRKRPGLRITLAETRRRRPG